jgi:serine protease AprX
MFKKAIIALAMLSTVFSAWSKAIIDSDMQELIKKYQNQILPKKSFPSISSIVFLDSEEKASVFIKDMEKLKDVFVKKFDSLPLVIVKFPTDPKILDSIVNHPSAMQISSYHPGQEELEFSQQAILLKPSEQYSTINNWRDNSFTGKNSIVGLLDSGIATEHSSLNNKHFITRTEKGSGYEEFKNGVRTAHGTGVACIYVGAGNSAFPNDTGIAQDAVTIVNALAGEGDGNMDDLVQTLSSLDWMLNRAESKPDVINYSFGNGLTNCSNCPDWSGLAKVVDYVVNYHHILWVKSAGNGGYIASSTKPPYAATMSTPADNYNALTVANMNPVIKEDEVLKLNPSRDMHSIRYTSSRGPTINGRKKPDISAPGNDTRTCAPDPTQYPFSYTKSMDYKEGYRLMGGTSSAAPHVGAATLLLHNAGIVEPIAKKALLINSADAYTDSGKPGPDDPKNPYEGGHFPVMGSEWNRTYGWGYINMQKAYDERNNLIQDTLTLESPEKIYNIELPVGGKITLVHERRVGYTDSKEWNLSHLSLEIIDKATGKLIMRDNSSKDTVHQVANCQRKPGQNLCSKSTRPIHAQVKVKLLGSFIDGSKEEPFVLASSVALN